MTDRKLEFDRSMPPGPGHPKDVSFPEYFEHRLANGLRILVYEQRTLPLVSMQLVAEGGASQDGATPGLATFTMEMLTKGTTSRSSHDIAEEIESRGGSIWSGAGWDSCSIGITILSRQIQHAVDVLADVARRPGFPEEEIERLRELRMSEILQDKASPNVLAWQRFCATLYAQHPYANPQDGTEASIAAIGAEQLRAFHAQRFTPSGSFLVVVGDANAEQIVELASRYFADWHSPAAQPSEAPALPPAPGRTVHIVDRPSAVQTSVLVGHAGLSRGSTDFIPVSVMNTLFGGYFGSRLNLNLREARGYTYGAHSRFDARRQAGPFAAGAEVRSEATYLAIEEILQEMQRLREETVSEEELDKVKNYVTGSFPLQIETPAQVAQRIITIELYGLEKQYYNRFNSTVLGLTVEDIRQAAQSYLHPDTTVIVAAGRGSQLRNTLERFGSVLVFDADGNIIPNSSPIAQDL
jgi:zinc protease